MSPLVNHMFLNVPHVICHKLLEFPAYSHVSCKQFESPAWYCQTLFGKTYFAVHRCLSFSCLVTHKACTVTLLQLVQSYASLQASLQERGVEASSFPAVFLQVIVSLHRFFRITMLFASAKILSSTALKRCL